MSTQRSAKKRTIDSAQRELTREGKVVDPAPEVVPEQPDEEDHSDRVTADLDLRKKPKLPAPEVQAQWRSENNQQLDEAIAAYSTYDSGSRAENAVSRESWTRFIESLGYHNTYYTQMGDASQYITGARKGTGNSNYLSTKTMKQTIAGQKTDGRLYVTAGPLKVFKALGAPFGNYQVDTKDFTPKTEKDIGNVKYLYTWTNSGFDGNDYRVKDPIGTESAHYLMDIDASAQKAWDGANLGKDYDLRAVSLPKKEDGSYFIEGQWFPYRDPTEADKEAVEQLQKCKYKGFNRMFNKTCNLTAKMMEAPLVYRLNPAYALDKNAPKLLSVPWHEQSAWINNDDMTFVVFHINRVAGKDKQHLCLDIHSILTLGSAEWYNGTEPSDAWFAMTQEREVPTAEALYDMSIKDRVLKTKKDDPMKDTLKKIREDNEEYYRKLLEKMNE